jgi:hypothetical protein
LMYPPKTEDRLLGWPRLLNHTDEHSSEFPAGTRAERFLVIFPLILGVFLILTNHWFGEVDDEITIINHAVKPVSQTLRLFLRGVGEHEHPPLYDIILHGWLLLTAGNEHLLRIPAICFYVLGAWTIALVARRLGGIQSQIWVLILITIWPFGFHFGRLATWYSFCFLLVSVVTLTYFKFITRPTPANWALLFVASLALIYSNYFGFVVLGFMAFDYFLRSRRDISKSLLFLLTTGVLLLVAYLPIMRAFWYEAHKGVQSHGVGLSLIANGIYGMYCMFMSESVAPWFWFFSVPAGIAAAVCILFTVWRNTEAVRNFSLYFLGLFLLMALLGIAIPKRLLLISPWLLLSIAVTLGTVPSRRIRHVLVVSLAITTGVGWYGIFSRRLYAAPHWIENWEPVAQQAAEIVRNHGTVIGDNPSFFFYLTYLLPTTPSEVPGKENFSGYLPGSVQTPGVYDAPHWAAANRPASSMVLLVDGPHFEMPSVDEPKVWLDENCSVIESIRMVHDSGWQWKHRFAQGIDQPEWRIQVKRYVCK